jgi:hypothetical protein
MTEISEEDRELVRKELIEIADRLRKRYRGLSIPNIRRFLKEMLSVSV